MRRIIKRRPDQNRDAVACKVVHSRCEGRASKAGERAPAMLAGVS